jgi:NAD(P)-dependent dehydrogenase (short-subunit alcohol dehydrogenase family)
MEPQFNVSKFEQMIGIFSPILRFVSFYILAPVLSVVEFISILFHTLLRIVLLPFNPPLRVHRPTASFHPVVLITGCSSGVGKELALQLAQRGYKVFAGIRKIEDTDSLHKEWLALKGKDKDEQLLEAVILDVTDFATIASTHEFIEKYINENKSALAAIINNAGLAEVSPMELADVQPVFDVNYFGPIALTRSFLPLLKTHQGRVINIGSSGAWFLGPGFGAYCSSKAAFETAMRVWRMELDIWRVPVVIVEPGLMGTKLWERGIENFKEYFEDETATTVTTSTSPSTETSPTPPIPVNREELRKAYARMMTKIYLAAHLPKEVGQPASNTADVTVHALTSIWPKRKYLVGLDARISALLFSLLPEGLVDWVLVTLLT